MDISSSESGHGRFWQKTIQFLGLSKTKLSPSPWKAPIGPFTLGSILATLIVFLPAFITGISTIVNSVNIPVWDDWERGIMLQKYYEQTPDLFTYMTGAHIDHRMIVPRVLIIGMNELTGGNLRFEILLSFSIYTMGAICLFLLLKKTMGNNTWMYLTALLVNIALFSPVQYQNFLWAVQIAMLLPVACLGVMVFAFRSNWKPLVKFLVVVSCAWIGTHSFGHGLILWPVALLMAALLPQMGNLKKRLTFAVGVAGVGLATVLTYFLWNFKNVSVHAYGQQPGETPPGVKNFAGAPDEIFQFVVASMGNATARIFPDVIQDAPTMGTITLIALIAALVGCGFVLLRNRSQKDLNELLPWLAVAGFAVTTMFAIALGRSVQGWEKAVMSRYAGPSVLLAASLVVLISWLLKRWSESSSTRSGQEFRTRWAIGLTCAWFALQIPTWSHSLHKMEQWKLARFQQKAALLYVNHFTPKKYSRLDHTLDFAVEQARYLNGKGLIKPALFEKADFGEFEQTKTILSESRANMFGATLTHGGIWIDGFATLRDPERVADGVLITYRRKGSEEPWQVAEMAEMETVYFNPNMAIDNVFSGTRNFYRPKFHAAWQEMLSLEGLPKGEVLEFSCWAMDAQKMRVQRLKHTFEFDAQNVKIGTTLFDPKKVKEQIAEEPVPKLGKKLALTDWPSA